MFTLFKKKQNNVILKLFRTVTIDQAITSDTKGLISLVLSSLNSIFSNYPTHYYITGPYPDEGWKTKDGFLKAVERKQYKNICHLIFSTEKYTFSFQNWLLNDTKPKEKDYQELEFSIQEKYCDYSLMEVLFTSIIKTFPADYGFILKLPVDYLPSTETKIKRGLFGSSMPAISQREKEWHQNAIRVNNAFLKDIYPINFINSSVINNDYFKSEIVSSKIGSIINCSTGLWKWNLSDDEIQTAKMKLCNSGLLLTVTQ